MTTMTAAAFQRLYPEAMPLLGTPNKELAESFLDALQAEVKSHREKFPHQPEFRDCRFLAPVHKILYQASAGFADEIPIQLYDPTYPLTSEVEVPPTIH